MLLEIKFKGGLGNQLFQYAAGRSLSIQNGIPFIFLNTDNYKIESLGRTFQLSNFQIKGSVLKNNSLKKVFRKHTKLNTIFSTLRLYKSIEESDFTLQKIHDKTGILTSLIGYWQSSFYFNEIRKVLLNELTPIQLPSYPIWVHNKNTVAVHIRRTDYLEESRYGFLGLAYYQFALSVMKQKLSNPLFIIFSDDLNWCKKTFKDDSFVFFEDTNWAKDYLQLYLISKCAHQVIANSSFSWWGAWLNVNPNKIVIRPAKPFVDNKLLYESHYPQNWIVIDN
jgi:hypothetical protein